MSGSKPDYRSTARCHVDLEIRVLVDPARAALPAPISAASMGVPAQAYCSRKVVFCPSSSLQPDAVFFSLKLYRWAGAEGQEPRSA